MTTHNFHLPSQYTLQYCKKLYIGSAKNVAQLPTRLLIILKFCHPLEQLSYITDNINKMLNIDGDIQINVVYLHSLFHNLIVSGPIVSTTEKIMQIFSCLKRNDVDIFGVLHNCPTIINLIFFITQKRIYNTMAFLSIHV